MTLVFDASAMNAFLRAEPGWELVRDSVGDPGNDCFAHALNLCEVYYDFRRSLGEQRAQGAIRSLLAGGIVPQADLDEPFWREAGRIKADVRRVSLADCFCIALARRLSAEVVTAGHHEFDAIVPLGLCAIRFIR